MSSQTLQFSKKWKAIASEHILELPLVAEALLCQLVRRFHAIQPTLLLPFPKLLLEKH